MINKRRTKLLDNHKALKGKQSRLPDELQAKIIHSKLTKKAAHSMMSHTAGGLEARMVKRQLNEVREMAEELYCCIDDYDDIHEWVQVKMATIHDRLNSVHSYMMYEKRYPKMEPMLGKHAQVEYRGQTFPGYNKPIRNDDGGRHKMKVLAKKGDKVKLVRFGHRGYKHNYSKSAKSNYLSRSAGIRDKSGNLTMNDKFSPNYWSRKVLWPSRQKADGKAASRRRSR